MKTSVSPRREPLFGGAVGQKTSNNRVFWCFFCCLFFVFFKGIFCYFSLFYQNLAFYSDKTHFFACGPSCVMKAKMCPTWIFAFRQVILELPCGSGEHFRGGAQRVFVCQLLMMAGSTKACIYKTSSFPSVKLRSSGVSGLV